MAHEGCCGGHNHGEHKDGECCNNKHDHDLNPDFDNEGYERVTISLDGEVDIECSVLGVFEVADREYVALLPLDEEECLIFRYTLDGDNVTIDNIESDEEYEQVAEVFYELFMMDEEDEEFDPESK